MGIGAFHLIKGKVMHHRIFPKTNIFKYDIYYISVPLDRLDDIPIAYNKFGLMSFFDKDHGKRDGKNLHEWAIDILSRNGVSDFTGNINLITMPRILGYCFNPVSFWLCLDKNQELIAYFCEVNNTFGETHTYICKHHDNRPIKPDDILKGEKMFHVSPFLERDGQYHFSLSSIKNAFNARIDFYDSNDQKQLVTTLSGKYKPMNRKSVVQTMIAYPLITIKTITLIHWQAFKLICKKIKVIKKPKQLTQRVTTTTQPSGTNSQKEKINAK